MQVCSLPTVSVHTCVVDSNQSGFHSPVQCVCQSRSLQLPCAKGACHDSFRRSCESPFMFTGFHQIGSNLAVCREFQHNVYTVRVCVRARASLGVVVCMSACVFVCLCVREYECASVCFGGVTA